MLTETNSARPSGYYKILSDLAHFKAYCVMCKVELPQKALATHHIDETTTNNDLTNLVVLCSSCHRKIHRRNVRLSNPLPLDRGFSVTLIRETIEKLEQILLQLTKT
jgi:hypothetical protein